MKKKRDKYVRGWLCRGKGNFKDALEFFADEPPALDTTCGWWQRFKTSWHITWFRKHYTIHNFRYPKPGKSVKVWIQMRR